MGSIVDKETSVIITQKLVTEDNKKLDMEAAEMEKPFMSVETTSDLSYNLLNQTREETEPVDKTNIIVAEIKSPDEGKPMSAEKEPDTADEKSSLVIEQKSASTVEKETSVVITQEP